MFMVWLSELMCNVYGVNELITFMVWISELMCNVYGVNVNV